MTSTGGEPTLIYYIGTPKRIVKRLFTFFGTNLARGGFFSMLELAKAE